MCLGSLDSDFGLLVVKLRLLRADNGAAGFDRELSSLFLLDLVGEDDFLVGDVREGGRESSVSSGVDVVVVFFAFLVLEEKKEFISG